MKKITTVCGDIRPEELGVTSMHEHMLYSQPVTAANAKTMMPPIDPAKLEIKPENMMFLRDGAFALNEELVGNYSVDYMVKEVNAFKELGGQSILDSSPTTERINIQGIQEISKRTGVNIVCSTGNFILPSLEEKYLKASQKELHDLYVRELTEGIDETTIRAGVVKSAMGTPGADGLLCQQEMDMLLTAAEVAAETGRLLHVHGTFGFEFMSFEAILHAVDEVLNKTGLSADRLHICHVDCSSLNGLTLKEYFEDDKTRSISLDNALQILDRGVSIGIDGWGMMCSYGTTIMPNDYDRVKLLAQLVRRGYADRIVLGHDFLGRLSGIGDGGYGITRWPSFLPGMLAYLGFGEEVMKTITVDNPARMLAY